MGNFSKFSKAEVAEYNNRLSAYYNEKAACLRTQPTETELQMKEFLRNHHICYRFKDLMSVKDSSGFIDQCHIVDFLIPDKKVVITISFKSFLWEDPYNDKRFALLKRRCPKFKFVHWSSRDFNSYNNMRLLLALLK